MAISARDTLSRTALETADEACEPAADGPPAGGSGDHSCVGAADEWLTIPSATDGAERRRLMREMVFRALI